MKEITKKRMVHGVRFLILLSIEVIIALFVHDNFIRPYIGDMLVVVVIYEAFRMIEPNKCRYLPFYIFLFAGSVEVLQYFQLVKLLGVENNDFLRILMGSVFDVKDVVSYGIGCILLELYERWVRKM